MMEEAAIVEENRCPGRNDDLTATPVLTPTPVSSQRASDAPEDEPRPAYSLVAGRVRRPFRSIRRL
jgi:hypothetical protein